MFAAAAYASVQAKVRARTSRLLTPADWGRLIDARDAARALDALARTPWAEATVPPADATPDGVVQHALRGIRRRVHRETLELADDVPHRAAELLRASAARTLVRDLTTWIRALHHGRPAADADAASILDPATTPEVARWRAARTVADLVAAAQEGRYGAALARAYPRYQAEGRAFYLEVALELAHGRDLVARVAALRGRDAGDAARLVERPLARRNLLAAARYRDLMGVRPERIVAFTLHRIAGGGRAAVQRIAAGGPLVAEAAAVGLEDVPPDLRGEAAIRAFEHHADVARRRDARTRTSGAPFGVGLPLAYLTRLDAEADDLVTLLEGHAADLGRDALRAHLAARFDSDSAAEEVAA